MQFFPTLTKHLAKGNPFLYALGLTIIVVLLSFASVGYAVGIHDQGVYVPIVRQLLDPTSYPGDPLLSTLKDNTTILWVATLPMFQLIGIEWGMFILQIVGLTVFLTGVYFIVATLSKNRYAGLVAVNIFAFRKLSFFTVTTFNDYFAPRFLALGIGVWALHFALQRRVLPATVLLLLACYVNMVIGLPLAGAVLLTFILNYKQLEWRKTAMSLGLFVVGLLPIVLFRATGTTSGVGLAVDKSWFDFVYNALYVYFDLPSLTGDAIGNLSTIFGVAYLLLTPILIWQTQLERWTRSVLLSVFASLAGVFVVNYFFIFFYPATVLMQLQLTRVSIFFPVLFYLVYACWLWQKFEAKRQVLAFGMIWGYVGLGPLFVATVWLSERWELLRQMPRRTWLGISWFLSISLLAAFFPAVILLNDNSGVNIFPAYSPEVDVQNWLRYNTLRDAHVIAPVDTNELYTPNFRVFSERTVFATNSELGVVAVTTGFQRSVRERLDEVSMGRFSQMLPTRNYGTIFAALDQGYNSLTERDFRRLAKKYELDYVVTKSRHELPFELVYANERFNIYKL
jgi:hypothetical protein